MSSGRPIQGFRSTLTPYYLPRHMSSSRGSGTARRTRRGGITKTGNAHLRRIVIEAAWAYQHRPSIGRALRQRQTMVTPEVKELAWKAQHRLHARYRHLTAKGKCRLEVVTAVSRELLGFIWAIGVQVETQTRRQPSAAA